MISTGPGLRRLCTFWVADQHYGLDIDVVREVLKGQSSTPVPAASDVVGGLINLRGEIVTAIDLARRLGVPTSAADGDRLNVVASLGDEVMSLIVDAVGDVVDLPEDQMDRIPPTVAPEVREVLVGVYRAGDDLIQVLDASKLLPRARQTQ